MAFQTIVAKHPGKCRRCGEDVKVGATCRWLRGRGVWHLKDDCWGGADEAITAEPTSDVEYARLSTGELVEVF